MKLNQVTVGTTDFEASIAFYRKLGLALIVYSPPRTLDAPEPLRSFVYAEPKPGSIFLWESWLRHEVVPGTGKGERISISFNYRL